MSEQFIEPLSLGVSYVNPDGTFTSEALSWFTRLVERIVAADQSQLSNVAAVQQVLEQLKSAVAQASAAAQASNSNTTVATSGSEANRVGVTTSWSTACTVALTGVAAGDFSGSVTLEASPFSLLTGGVAGAANYGNTSGYGGYGDFYGQLYYTAAGEFGIVENDGSDETLYTGTFTVVQYATVNGNQVVVTIDDPAALRAFSSSRSNTGNVTYKLDLRMTTAGSALAGLDAYFFAQRP
jgi:hypothetical protein